MMKYIAILLAILGFNLVLSGQTVDLRFLKSPHNDKLTSANVSSVTEDKLGFMWFGSSYGLHRYDGYEMVHYLSDKGLNYGLTDYNILALFSDVHGRIWISLNTSLCYYDYSLDSIVVVSTESAPNGLLGYGISCFAEDEDSVLYVAAGNTIYSFNEKDKLFTEEFRLFDYVISSFCFDKEGKIWGGCTDGGGIFQYNRRSKQYLTYKIPADLSQKSSIADLLFYDNKLWLGTNEDGVVTYDTLNNVFYKYPIETSYASQVIDLYVDRENHLWSVDLTGLKLYNKEFNYFEGYYFEQNNEYSIPQNIRKIYQDRNLNYWTVHYPGGIGFSPKSKGFIRFDSKINSPFRLSTDIVSCINEDVSGNLFMGNAYNGINVFYWQRGGTTVYQNREGDRKSLGKGAIQDIFRDSKGQLWVGSYWGGLQRFNSITEDFVSYTNDPADKSSISSNDVRSIAEDQQGNLWICSHGKGVDKFNPVTGKFQNYNYAQNGLSNDFTFEIVCDKDNAIWVATAWGLSVLKQGEEKFKTYFSNKDDSLSLSSDVIQTVFVDRLNRVWVGTPLGLNLYMPDKDGFKAIDDGFYNRNVLSIIDDDENNIWLGTSHGLIKYDPETGWILNLNKEDGLISNDFVARSVFNNGKNTLFFGTLHGLNYFNPKELYISKQVPPVFLTRIKLFYQEITSRTFSGLTSNIAVCESVHLKHNQNTIGFEYAALTYAGTEENQYAYYLEGFEDTWNYVGKKREATYTNLPPGNYTFRVKGINKEGIWNNEGASIRIHIAHPFWTTWWFRLIMVLAFFLLVYLVVSIRERFLRKENELLETKVRERTKEIVEKNILLENQKIELQKANDLKNRFFSILAHDLRGPIFSMMQLSSMLKNNRMEEGRANDPKVLDLFEQASQNTYKLLEDLLLWGKTQTNNVVLQMERIDLVKLIQGVNESLAIIASNKGLTIRIIASSPVIIMSDVGTLKVVFRNLISNALKFSYPNAEVLVCVETTEMEYIIRVEDFGVGISDKVKSELFNTVIKQSGIGTAGEKGSGLGMSLARELVELNRGRIWFESELKKGSKFFVALPFPSVGDGI